MINSVIVRKTGQKVFPLMRVDGNYTMCVFPFAHGQSRRGNNGHCQPVRNNNLMTLEGVQFEGLAAAKKVREDEGDVTAPSSTKKSTKRSKAS